MLFNTIEEYEKIHFVTYIYAFYSSSDTLWMVFESQSTDGAPTAHIRTVPSTQSISVSMCTLPWNR